MKEFEVLEMRQAEEAARIFQENEAAARRHFQATASIPIPDDPPLFSQQEQINSFPNTQATVQYLKSVRDAIWSTQDKP